MSRRNKHARTKKTPVTGRGPRKGTTWEDAYRGDPRYEDIDFSKLGDSDGKKKDKKPTYVPDTRNCTICGEKFDGYKRGIKQIPRSDRKEQYAFCSKKCLRIFNRGVIPC